MNLFKIFSFVAVMAFAFADGAVAYQLPDGYEEFPISIKTPDDPKSSLVILYYKNWIGMVQNSGDFRFYRPHELNKNLIWTLVSFKSDDGERVYNSGLALSLIDCPSLATNIIQFTGFSGFMGTGRIVGNFKYEENKWDKVSPSSDLGTFLKSYCKRLNGQKN